MTFNSMRRRRLLTTLAVGATLLGATARHRPAASAAPARASACVYCVKVFA